MNDDIKLIGFIHQYGEDDFSIWTLELDKEDEDAIMAILDKYEDCGCSIRGNGKMTITEV